MINGKEADCRTGGLAVGPTLPDPLPKPLTSYGGIAVPLNVTSPQVSSAAGGPALSPRKRSVSDRAALEDSIGWGKFAMMPASPVVTSPYPVTGSVTSGMTSGLFQSEDPSSLLTEIVGQPFSDPSGARGILPSASPVKQAVITNPCADQEVPPGGTEGFPSAPDQRTGVEEDNPYAALARSLSMGLDSFDPGVSDQPQKDNPVLVALVTNHLRSLLDEQAEHLKETGDATALTPGQVARLREQHVQVSPCTSAMSSVVVESNPLGGPRISEIRTFVL